MGTAAGGKIALTGKGAGAANSEITVKGAGDIAIKSDAAGNLTVDGSALKDKITEATGSLQITSVKNEFAETGEFTTEVATSAGTKKAPAVTPIIKLGSNTAEHKFASGVATLPVYTKTEVDKKIEDYFQAADAMVYKGYVDGTEDHALPTTGKVECGWTYKVAAAGTYAGKKCKVGDLLIAKADANPPTNDTWDLIPSGDEQTITGAATDTGITVSDGSGVLAGITLANGNCTTVAGTKTGNVTTVKINHNAATGTITTGSAANVTQEAKGTAEFSAITDIARDAYGHVTGTTVHKIKVVDTDTHNEVSAVKVAATHTGAGAQLNVTVMTNDKPAGVTGTIDVTSDNLKITNGTATGTTEATGLKINLEWDSF